MAIGAAGIAARLRETLPADRVIDDPATLLPYAYDASFWSLRQRRVPEAVVVPESTAEVVSVVRVANETGTPTVARGAGTGQTGGAIAPEGGSVLTFSRMRRIPQIDRPNLQTVVAPGLAFFGFPKTPPRHGPFFPTNPPPPRPRTPCG